MTKAVELNEEALAEMEAKARAATPGPYRACNCGLCGLVWSTTADVLVLKALEETDGESGVDRESRNHNALYAATASPELMLVLVAEVRLLREQRDEARAWVRRLTAAERVLTCVYCGEAYPPGAPNHGADVLTAHVRVCLKHPMRTAEDDTERRIGESLQEAGRALVKGGDPEDQARGAAYLTAGRDVLAGKHRGAKEQD